MEPERIKLLTTGRLTAPVVTCFTGCRPRNERRCNPALEHAIALADKRGLPVVVGFGLMDDTRKPTCATTGSCWRGSARRRQLWSNAASGSCYAAASLRRSPSRWRGTQLW